ncbi:CO/xanthine dehydrogenase FAD-binding subunit [Microbacterium halimionae]|uniref:CO/xanthine dehydrogenase FAD-binding subunit n=1 Tax=Microbacterium halimionae TaxID=1526413 RepID=A0A7W3JRA3_9MICO|nr:FAD binding domain-containing protein [Microbacterium halimionae]MBA8817551.1 CO/xanthine dehydrogenase FAD-binding subunit [Microbacterium halimionae]NII94261.1 CO/xanthine dehydrogenase FAD-binding subunit [Microbacterium halimionae]
MDINTVTSFRAARSRDALTLAPSEDFIAGGTWVMSEPQPETTGFVDLTTMAWTDIEILPDGLRISATCTIARLLAWATDSTTAPAEWTALALVPDAADALLASFKIWNTATVGGNVCRSFAAGAMVSFAAALDGVAWIWQPDGGERREPVAGIITGNGENNLARGEVLRAVELPAYALRSTALLRKIALAELGRSGCVVTGRVDEDDSATFVVTAATLTPHVMRFEALPTREALTDAVASAPDFYTDPLGSADWRRGVSIEFAQNIRGDLEATR